MVVFILIGSTCFSVVFRASWRRLGRAPVQLAPGGWIGFLIVVNLFIFFTAFFLDFFEIAFIVVPMLAPVAVKVLAPVVADSMGGNPEAAATAALVWFGVMLCVNMQTSSCIRRSASRCSTCAASPQGGQSSGHLLGRPALGGAAAGDGAAGDVLARHGDGPARQGSLHHSNSAEVSIPLGNDADKGGGSGAASAPGSQSCLRRRRRRNRLRRSSISRRRNDGAGVAGLRRCRGFDLLRKMPPGLDWAAFFLWGGAYCGLARLCGRLWSAGQRPVSAPLRGAGQPSWLGACGMSSSDVGLRGNGLFRLS